MEGALYRQEGAWFVALAIAGVLIDQAGPFDDEGDAMEAMERSLAIAEGM